ncbi:mucin-2-like [Ananas comosus]|uniref:Mucin-2-like n=1 Tax=Ananas comosus TaxID=4615 RepID=A0A6P5GCU1_ANACO|nr:mucin-2-like [Ananas comosus]
MSVQPLPSPIPACAVVPGTIVIAIVRGHRRNPHPSAFLIRRRQHFIVVVSIFKKMVRPSRRSNTNNEQPRNPPPTRSGDANLNTTLVSLLHTTSSAAVPPQTTVPPTIQNPLQSTTAPQINPSAFAPPPQQATGVGMPSTTVPTTIPFAPSTTLPDFVPHPSQTTIPTHSATLPQSTTMDPLVATLIQTVVGLVQTQQQNLQQNPVPSAAESNSRVRERSINEFKKSAPPPFSGTTNLDEAETWIKEMEKAFSAM